MTEARAAIARQLSERAFQAMVCELAGHLGYLVYHTHDSRRSQPGFPDTVMVRRQRVIYAELKSMRGRLRPEQRVWIDALRAAGQDVYLWRPNQWAEIEQVLR